MFSIYFFSPNIFFNIFNITLYFSISSLPLIFSIFFLHIFLTSSSCIIVPSSFTSFAMPAPPGEGEGPAKGSGAGTVSRNIDAVEKTMVKSGLSHLLILSTLLGRNAQKGECKNKALILTFTFFFVLVCKLIVKT